MSYKSKTNNRVVKPYSLLGTIFIQIGSMMREKIHKNTHNGKNRRFPFELCALQKTNAFAYKSEVLSIDNK